MEKPYIVETIKKHVGHEQIDIIKSIFENSDDRPIHGVDRKSFRSRNPQWMDELSTMESAQFLIKSSKDSTRLRITVFALPLLDHSIAEQYLDLMDELVPMLDSLYQKTFDKPIQMEKLYGKFPNIGETLFKNIIFYLGEIGGILHPVSAEQINESAQLVINEQIRKIRSARERIYEIYSWKVKHINPFSSESKKDDTKEISLVGTWSGDVNDIENLSRRIMDDKRAAVWWSFVIDGEVQKRLKKPFFLYINFKTNSIKFRLRVIDFSSVFGAAGHSSPWPEFTLPNERNMSRSGEKKSNVFKTWFLIDDVLQFNEPMTIESFEPAQPWSNKQNLLNQNAFGYAYIKPRYSTGIEVKNFSIEKNGYIVAGVDSATEEDSLGRTPLAEALAAMLAAKEQKSPFTFAILGEWGTGKSSLVRMITKNLKIKAPETFEYVQFNAWAYESCHNMAAALAQEITSGLINKRGLCDKVFLSFKFAWRSRKFDIIWAILFLIVSVISAFYLIKYFNQEQISNFLGISIGLPSALAALFAIYKIFSEIMKHPFATHLKTFTSLPKFREHFGLTQNIKEEIILLCKMVLNDEKANKRLFIFIDDLDRCRPSQILNVLEAVGLVTSIENVFVVLAIDPRILIESAKYFQRETNREPGLDIDILARDYLGKIFQLLVSLDKPEKETISNFISSRLFHNVEYNEPVNTNTDQTVLNSKYGITAQEENTKIPEKDSSSKPGVNLIVKTNESPNSFKFLPNTPDEMLYFIESSELFDIKNPRQLIRLHNSYNLLKILSPNSFYSDGGNSLIKILFLKEFLQKFKRDEQKTIENYILNSQAKLDSIKVEYELIEGIKREIGESFSSFNDPFEFDRFTRLCAFVNRFIIPSI